MSLRKKQRIGNSEAQTTRSNNHTNNSRNGVRNPLNPNGTQPRQQAKTKRKQVKRLLNNEIDTRDPKTALNFDFIQNLPDVAFSTEYNTSDEDNPNDPELYEKNDLIDWEKPKSEREMEEQNHIVQHGIADLVERQNRYHKNVLIRNKIQEPGNGKNKDVYTTLGPRVSQRDSSHTILSPDMLTRYGQGNSAVIYQLVEDYSNQFISVINHCYNTIHKATGYPKALKTDTVLSFKNGFWVENDEDQFLASEKCSFLYLMLNPIIGICDHIMVDTIDSSIQQNGTTMIKRISMNNPKNLTDYFYEFDIFYIDTTSDDDIPSGMFFLILIFKYTNVVIPSLMEKKKISITPEKPKENVPSNCKTMVNYVLFRVE